MARKGLSMTMHNLCIPIFMRRPTTVVIGKGGRLKIFTVYESGRP